VYTLRVRRRVERPKLIHTNDYWLLRACGARQRTDGTPRFLHGVPSCFFGEGALGALAVGTLAHTPKLVKAINTNKEYVGKNVLANFKGAAHRMFDVQGPEPLGPNSGKVPFAPPPL
jgi:hypothetical protein